MQVLWGEQTCWWRTELLGEEMDGFFFFGITHRLCVRGKEWVAAFSGAQPVLHTCLYSRIDLGALSHGWNMQREKQKSYVSVKTLFVRYLCVGRMWVKSVPCCACVCVCARVSLSVGCRNTQCFFFFFFFFATVTHHGSIVLGFPANHMSGVLMFMPSHINQISLKMISWCKVSEKK